MTPIFEKILEVAEKVEKYQEINNVDLIDNIIWDEIMLKFKNNEELNEEETNKTKITNEEDSLYLFDYGEKISDNDSKKLFDYVNYINIFNDLIIPNEIRGKKFSYPELYKEFYFPKFTEMKQPIDIKEYEPNEEENENLRKTN